MQSPGQNSKPFVTFIRAVSVLLYTAVWGRFKEVIDIEKVGGLKIANWSVTFQTSVFLMSFFNSGLKTATLSIQEQKLLRILVFAQCGQLFW